MVGSQLKLKEGFVIADFGMNFIFPNSTLKMMIVLFFLVVFGRMVADQHTSCSRIKAKF